MRIVLEVNSKYRLAWAHNRLLHIQMSAANSFASPCLGGGFDKGMNRFMHDIFCLVVGSSL